MKIDISSLSGELGKALSFNRDIKLESITFSGEKISFPEPLKVKGTIINSDGEVFLIIADVEGNIMLQCGTCTGEYKYHVEFSFEAKSTKNPSVEDPDMFFHKDDYIDIREMIMEFLLLEIPLKRKCSENCKGLCPICGVNRNQKNCKCNSDEDNDDPYENIDPRLQALKDFFSSDDKEV